MKCCDNQHLCPKTSQTRRHSCENKITIIASNYKITSAVKNNKISQDFTWNPKTSNQKRLPPKRYDNMDTPIGHDELIMPYTCVQKCVIQSGINDISVAVRTKCTHTNLTKSQWMIIHSLDRLKQNPPCISFLYDFYCPTSRNTTIGRTRRKQKHGFTPATIPKTPMVHHSGCKMTIHDQRT